MKKLIVNVEKITDGVVLPVYMTDYSSGMDLYASMDKDVVLNSLERALIPTGLKVEIPNGYEFQIRPRSGLAWKNGISVLNTPGTIDSDYRGEIKVILANLSKDPFIIKPGERIAQMVMCKVEKVHFKIVKKVRETVRGSGGFGHTGK